MRFYTPEWNVKRRAKRLKKVLRTHGYDVSYTACLDLMARLYGFAHYRELQHAIGGQPLSLFDEYVDDETLEGRFLHQELVMAEEGLAEIAGAVLDDVNPTGSGNRPALLNDAGEVTVG